MTRARDRGPTRRRRPFPSPLSRRVFTLAVVLAAAAAACGQSTLGPSSAIAPSPSESGAVSSPAPAASATSGGAATGGTEASPTASDPSAASAAPSPSDGGALAPGCSGDEKNRSFFAAAAANLPWDVYCGVLPDGWFVEAGNYRLAGGGTLRLTYDGPNAARLELREGAICADSADCRPSGQALGPAAYGNRQGDLVALEGGGYAIVVDPDQPLSWMAVSANLDEAAFRDIAAALLLVAP